MRSWRPSNSASLLTLLLAAGALPARAAEPTPAPAEHGQTVDRIVAVVNDDIILLSELARQSGPYEERAASEATDPVGRAIARKQVRQKVLDDLVADKLVESEAKDLKIEISDREVDQEMARIKKENNLSDADLARQAAAQGMDMKALREYVRKQAEKRKVIDARVSPRVSIADAEVRAYYEENYKNDDEVHVRIISKRIPQDASDEEVKRVKDGLETLRASVTSGGKDFGTIAKKESEGANPQGGGDLGWFKRGDVAPEIEEAAFALQPGEVSPVIELGGAYHILQVIERKSNPPKKFEDVQERIRALLFNRAAEKEYDRWIADLRAKSFVEVRLDGPATAE